MEWRLANLQGEYKKKTGKTLSIRKIAADTGLSKTTVSEIAAGDRQRPDNKTMELLLTYLSKMLERPLQTDDLWRYNPSPETATVTAAEPEQLPVTH